MIHIKVKSENGKPLGEWTTDAQGVHHSKGDLSFAEFSETNASRCVRWHPLGSIPWISSDWSNATCGEVGELANAVKKIRRHETGAVNTGDPTMEELLQEVADEIADVVIYADLTARFFGINLADAICAKFNRTSAKYGFPERLGMPAPPVKPNDVFDME